MSQAYHIPVMLHEVIDGLNIKPNGVYVDCTFGGGGHAKAILEKLDEHGKLVAFDQDADAKQNVPDDKRIVFVPHNFSHLLRFFKFHKIEKVDGILADLGVSSHQFDEGARGFSTRFNGPLDMRMNQQSERTASKILMEYTELQLHKMFEQYGEVTNSKTLAKHIIQNRQQASFQTIDSFKNLLAPVVKGNPHKYFAQVFQALRMEVNEEMESLKALLSQVPEALAIGGRIAVITFHSIEDRMVKNFLRQGDFDIKEENPFDRNEKEDVFKIITKKPITATEAETKTNSRSRSAKLRIAEKL